MRSGKQAYLVMAMMVGSLTPRAFARERELKPSEIPAVVLKAVNTRYPNARPDQCTLEEEKGTTLYEVKLEVAGRPTELMISPEGSLVAEEQVIEVSELPALVARTFSTSSHAGARVLRVERETKGKDTRYEFTLEEKGKKTELVIDANGQLVKNEETK